MHDEEAMSEGTAMNTVSEEWLRYN